MSGIFERITGTLRTLVGERNRPRSDRLVYAVGDVHGRADLVERLVEKILVDALGEAERHGESRPPVVFLGDLIDRGPDSRGVLEFISGMQEWPELELILLGGNHEAMLFEFLTDPASAARWMRHGGYEMLVSYGLERFGDLDNEEAMVRLSEELEAAMGTHLDLLQTCQPTFQDGNLAIVHAGADPNLPIDSQPVETLLWGSEAFERKRRTDGIWVVHGHTIVDKPIVRRGRIALDTGAYVTGKLSAMKIRGTDLQFLSETDGP